MSAIKSSLLSALNVSTSDVKVLVRMAKAARREKVADRAHSIHAAEIRTFLSRLPSEGKAELFALMRVGSGSATVNEWSSVLAEARRLDDARLTNDIVNNIRLDEHLQVAFFGRLGGPAKPEFGTPDLAKMPLAKRRGVLAAVFANVSMAFWLLAVASSRSEYGWAFVLLQGFIGTFGVGVLLAKLNHRLRAPLVVRGLIVAGGIWLVENVLILPLSGAGLFAQVFGWNMQLAIAASLAMYGALVGGLYDYFSRRERLAVAALKCFGSLLVVWLVVRTLLFQPFNQPGAGLEPTQLVGDYFLASKYSYGYSHFSLPLSLPLFAGRIVATEPHRGDVAVFRLPKIPSRDAVFRILGLPGDHIQMLNGALYINGAAVRRERAADFVDIEHGRRLLAKRWREMLPNGVNYYTLDLVENGFADNTQVYTVPANDYFVMGDNRDNAADSRFSQTGFIPFENLIGKAQLIFFSVREGERAWEFWRWHDSVRWDRLLAPIR